ncbi:MAG: hypothetical protein M3373_03285 [Gemmatimonadota bacterium]|nr:hypothetical protein [Gemmatimonadota bacterium]
MRPAVFAVFAIVLAVPACAKRHIAPGGGPTPVTQQVISGGSTSSIGMVAGASENERTINAPPDRVWEMLPAVYEALGVSATTIVTSDRIVGNDGLRVRRRLGTTPLPRYLDCGGTSGAPNAETYDVSMSLMTQLHPAAEGRTIVVTRVEASGISPFGGNTVTCTSTGALERRMFTMLSERLSG